MKQNPIQPAATSLSGVSKEEFAAMQEQMAAVLKQNAELLERLDAKPQSTTTAIGASEAPGANRVGDRR